MVVDSHHSTPREMTFESSRVRRDDHFHFSLEFSVFSPTIHWLTLFQKRDSFCQLLQMMKTRHSQLTEPDVISVFVGSWNMGKNKCDDRIFLEKTLKWTSMVILMIYRPVSCAQVAPLLPAACRHGWPAAVWDTPLMSRLPCSLMTSTRWGLRRTLRGRESGQSISKRLFTATLTLTSNK